MFNIGATVVVALAIVFQRANKFTARLWIAFRVLLGIDVAARKLSSVVTVILDVQAKYLIDESSSGALNKENKTVYSYV